jgi:hypothetical protein
MNQRQALVSMAMNLPVAKRGELHEWLSDYNLLKKSSTPCN